MTRLTKLRNFRSIFSNRTSCLNHTCKRCLLFCPIAVRQVENPTGKFSPSKLYSRSSVSPNNIELMYVCDMSRTALFAAGASPGHWSDTGSDSPLSIIRLGFTLQETASPSSQHPLFPLPHQKAASFRCNFESISGAPHWPPNVAA